MGRERHHGDGVGRGLPGGARRHALESAEIAVPAPLVRGPSRRETAGQGGARGAQGRLRVRAEAERERELLAVLEPRQRGLARLDEVAVRGGLVGPVHAEVLEVLPAVARSLVAAGRLREGGRRCQGARHRAAGVAREQRVSGGRPAVVHPVIAEPWVVERVQVERLAGQRLQADVDQQPAARRIGHVGLRDAEATGLLVDLAVGQAVRVGELDRAGLRLAVALGERLAVGDDEVERADARRVEVGVVDLGRGAVLERPPDLARGRRRRSVAVLVRGRPHGVVSGRPGSGRGERGGGGEENEQDDAAEKSHVWPVTRPDG